MSYLAININNYAAGLSITKLLLYSYDQAVLSTNRVIKISHYAAGLSITKLLLYF